MINIGSEVNKLIKEQGFPVLVIKRNNKLRCSCWNESSRSADSTCPTCLGTGFLVSIEKHLTYSKIASVPETLPRLVRNLAAGAMAIEARAFYFNLKVAPNRGDQIVVCDFRGASPVSPLSFFEINHSERYRADRGNTQYYKAFTSLQPINSSIKGFNLRQKQGVINYVPVYR